VWWEHGTQWLIQTSFSGDYIASFEGEKLAVWPPLPSFYWYSFEATTIVQTNAVCNGQWYTPLLGEFLVGGQANEHEFVMKGAYMDCYTIEHCDWNGIGPISGWEFQGQVYVFLTKPQNLMCDLFSSGLIDFDAIWVPCQHGNIE